MLSDFITNNVDLGEDATIEVYFASAPTLLSGTVNLIKIDEGNTDGAITGTLKNTTFESNVGATTYSFDIALEGGNETDGYKKLTAAFTGQKQVNQEKAKVYLDGVSARLTSLVNGADHMLSILDNWKCTPDPATPSGFCSFASVRGNTLKTRTGSSMKDHGASFALGGAVDTPTPSGTLTAGVFIEGGLGGYESDTPSGRGDGDTWHAGIGAFAKHAFANRVYLEGSVRAGRAKTDFEGKGNIATLDYDSKSNYWGAHAGVGYDHPLNEAASMDLYGKVLWTHQERDTVKTYAQERLSFDDANSLRSRIGARYRHTVKKDLRAHAGVGWEYEFDGKERAKLDGTRITHTPETRGHSALVEAGVEWMATKGWSFNANVTAMGGQRKGVSGFVQANYRF
jgi:outer membrane autotransporter protein